MQKQTSTKSRRGFISKATAGFIGGTAILATNAIAEESTLNQIEIRGLDDKHIYSPIEKIKLIIPDALTISIYDGKGNLYAETKKTKEFEFRVSGTLGNHIVVVTDRKGREQGRRSFRVTAKTRLEDASGTYSKLFRQLYWTMIGSEEGADMGRGGEAFPFYVEGEFYFTFVPWLRDHVHTLKGMKYFYPNIKSAIELFARYQREDGLIWDNFYRRTKEPNMWDKRFSYGNFIQPVDNYKFEFKRIPVEADMEFIFIEGVYFTWQASGDTEWMIGKLDNALRAVKYCTTDPYRWSTKYQLIKRGFTIDTWDFQSKQDAANTGDDEMIIDKEKTQFGVMFGDTTGLINACDKLVIMLNIANRKEEANTINQLAVDMQKRLDALAWNGKFYTHHVAEDPTYKRDLGADLNESFSLSNSYSLNRNIGHDKSVSIIKKYYELYQNKPDNAPGEWYGIYPPFSKGFEGTWEYVNGGVLPLVAGELAHGAFDNGFEDYAIDILGRVSQLASKYNDFLHGSFKGRVPEKPERTFETITLDKYANVSFSGTTSSGAIPWTNEGTNDLHEMVTGKQTLLNIPFQISNPQTNGNRGCIGIGTEKGYLPIAKIPFNKKAASIYFLHTKAGPSSAGFVTIVYKDLSIHSDEIKDNKIDGWWAPTSTTKFKVAWKGHNGKAPFVGVGIYGLDNPHPEKEVKEIILENAKSTDTKWFILGITLSDSPVYFKPDERSYGIPDRWGAAACMYALAEGLVGAVDTSMAFESAKISPRWAATKETKAEAVFKYEASDGYLAYQFDREGNQLRYNVSSSAKQRTYEILLPQTKSATALKVNGVPVVFRNKKIENSQYLCFDSSTNGNENIEITLS